MPTSSGSRSSLIFRATSPTGASSTFAGSGSPRSPSRWSGSGSTRGARRRSSAPARFIASIPARALAPRPTRSPTTSHPAESMPTPRAQLAPRSSSGRSATTFAPSTRSERPSPKSSRGRNTSQRKRSPRSRHEQFETDHRVDWPLRAAARAIESVDAASERLGQDAAPMCFPRPGAMFPRGANAIRFELSESRDVMRECRDAHAQFKSLEGIARRFRPVHVHHQRPVELGWIADELHVAERRLDVAPLRRNKPPGGVHPRRLVPAARTAFGELVANLTDGCDRDEPEHDGKYRREPAHGLTESHDVH